MIVWRMVLVMMVLVLSTIAIPVFDLDLPFKKKNKAATTGFRRGNKPSIVVCEVIDAAISTPLE